MLLFRTIVLVSTITASSFGQTTGFANLGFDLGQASNDPSIGLPYWKVGGTVVPSYGGEVKYFFYDSPAIDAWAVSIHDGKSEFSFAPISGRYSVYIQSGQVPAGPEYPNGFFGSASISQTAMVPANAHSLLFSASQLSDLQVLMQGQLLPFYKLQDRGTYSVYGADISSFAGTTSELKFQTEIPPTLTFGSALLDDIQFSIQAIPEPASISLLVAGLILSGFAFRTKRV